LTEEETNEALRLARKAKHFKVENEKYRKKLTQPVEYPKFNFEQTRKFALEKMIDICGDIHLTEANEEIINLLSLYFSGHSDFEKKHGYSLQKSIFLVGPVGC